MQVTWCHNKVDVGENIPLVISVFLRSLESGYLRVPDTLHWEAAPPLI